MPNNKTIFVCNNCDAQFAKWTGRCLECGKWGTIQEGQDPSIKSQNEKSNSNQYSAIKTVGLDEIKDQDIERIQTGIEELNRVLGGGLVPGSLILLGGEPGVGKSTLALQIADIIHNTMYISGEESVGQIKLRANRLKLFSKSLKLANETNIDSVIATVAKEKPTLLVIDSIQTISTDEVAGTSGNVNQVRACTVKLMEVAKKTKTIIIMVGQITKDGDLAGPKTLEHLVDTVLYLEGDKFHQFRLLRTAKNRFGSTDEVGVFSMQEFGLQEVANPSQAFISGRPKDVPGTTVTCLLEGTRPLLVEIQALVSKTNFGYPQRRTSGFDLNRLQVLIAVLSRRTGLPLDSYDVFLNVAGGMKANEPAADLAVVLAIASALKNKVLPSNLASFGEIGLGGEIRAVSQAKRRLQEIKKLGFEFAVMPHSTEQTKITGLKIAPVKNVKELVEKIIK
ncbi:MAG: DNA repair protein RadA [bacterium]